jgi:hypothetical protein
MNLPEDDKIHPLHLIRGEWIMAPAKPKRKPARPARKAAKRAPAKTAKLSGEVYHPPKDIIEQARLKDWDKLHRLAKKDFRAFWETEAKELEWQGKWKKVLDDSKKPFFK